MTWIVSYMFRNDGESRARRTRHDSLEDAQAKVENLLSGAQYLYGDSGFSNIRLLVETTSTETLEYHGTILGPEYVGDFADALWPTIEQTTVDEFLNVPPMSPSFHTWHKLRATKPGCYVCGQEVDERHDSECSQYRSWGRPYVYHRDTSSFFAAGGPRQAKPPTKMTAATEVGDPE